jgi:hypothetical protein
MPASDPVRTRQGIYAILAGVALLAVGVGGLILTGGLLA